MKGLFSIVSLVVLSIPTVLFLNGCGSGILPGLPPTDTIIVTSPTGPHGAVRGGQQPVTGSTIQLWAAGTTGYGSPATPLIPTGLYFAGGVKGCVPSPSQTCYFNVVSDSNGNFNITGDYTCTPGQLLYITASGGNPGLPSANNSALYLMAALGPCSLVASGLTINIDEVTTVAAAYALAQFMSPNSTYIGSYGYSSQGLINAFSTVNNLVNTATGNALATTPAGNGVVPQSELNTLANILSSCVNTASPSSFECTSLFAATNPPSGYVSPNTLQAALQIALHPGTNVAPLFSLSTSSTPFSPTLSSAPSDWTVALAYADQSSNPRSLAIDATGNVWVANYASGGSSSSVSLLNPNGSLKSLNASGLYGVSSVAIDTTGNAWLTNLDNSSLTGYNSAGNSFAGPFTNFNLSSPQGIAIDGSNNLWITNSAANSLTKIAQGPSGEYAVSPTSGYTGGGLSSPTAIAIDPSNNVWVANSSSITAFASSGTPFAASPYTGNSGPLSPASIAINAQSDVWASNSTSSSVFEMVNSSGTYSRNTYLPAGVTSSQTIAIDGANNVWVANLGDNSLSEITPTGNAAHSTGYLGGSIKSPSALAIDGSGNIWIANRTSTANGALSTNVSEFIGIAAPTITPLAAAISTNQVGNPPGTPIPVVIVSNTLPYYTLNMPYSAQLYAVGGNSGAYTWSLPSANLPSGLTLSSSGLISGTTSIAGSITITVQVADASNPSNIAAKTFTLTSTGNLPLLGNEAALDGTYSLLVTTFSNNNTSGHVAGNALIGSITFNGSGGISGEADFNSSSSSVSNYSTFVGTGYYNLGPDLRGTLILIPTAGGGMPLQFGFTASSPVAGVPQTLRLIEFDDTNASSGATGAGVAKRVTSSAFTSATLNQTFVFGLQGETPCSNCHGTVTPFGPLSAAGRFTANSSLTLTSGEEDAAAVGLAYNGIGLSGTFSTPDSFGRGSLTLAYTGTLYPAPPAHFVYYIVNAGELLLMSSDGHASTSLLTGDALTQTGSFTNASLSGAYILYEESGVNGDGVSAFPTVSSAFAGRLAINSPGSATLLQDQNNGSGQIKSEQSQGPLPYAIDANGRISLGSGFPIFYLASNGHLFGTEQPAVGSSPALLTGEPQSGASFSCADLAGNLSLGTLQPPLPTNDSSGYVTFANPSATSTLDQVSNGILTSAATTTYTCSSDSLTPTSGRLLFTGSNATYAVYPITQGQRYAIIDLTPTNSLPAIFILQK